MTDSFFIDSNVLIYAYDKSDVVKNRKARELLDKCWSGKVIYYTSAQNLAEFFVVVTGKIEDKLEMNTAGKIIDDFFDFHSWKVVRYDIVTLKKAVELHEKTKKHFWDALIVATMLEFGVTNIYTENVSDFSKFFGIKAINPFKS